MARTSHSGVCFWDGWVHQNLPARQGSRRIRLDQRSPVSFIRFIGITEILDAIGIIAPYATGILPILTPLAALGFAVIMLLAMIVHARATLEISGRFGMPIDFATSFAQLVQTFIRGLTRSA